LVARAHRAGLNARQWRGGESALPFSSRLPKVAAVVSEHPDDDHDSTGSDRSMGFWQHLDELRSTLVKSVVAFAICAGLVAYYTGEFRHFIMRPFAEAVGGHPDLTVKLGTSGLTEGVNMIVEMCMFGGLTLAAPFILFFVAQFVAPALTRKETKVVLPACVSAFILFLSGAAFAYFFLMPAAVEMFIKANLALEAEFRWSMGSYYTIFTRTVFGVGAGFEFPLLIVMLVWVGVLSTASLKKFRRHAIVVIFILAALITQSTDPFSQTLCAAPLYVLYEIAIWVSAAVEKHRDRSGTAVMLALLALCRSSRAPQTIAAARA
jgi:sec-independent protein translocase protein TatC